MEPWAVRIQNFPVSLGLQFIVNLPLFLFSTFLWRQVLTLYCCLQTHRDPPASASLVLWIKHVPPSSVVSVIFWSAVSFQSVSVSFISKHLEGYAWWKIKSLYICWPPMTTWLEELRLTTPAACWYPLCMDVAWSTATLCPGYSSLEPLAHRPFRR